MVFRRSIRIVMILMTWDKFVVQKMQEAQLIEFKARKASKKKKVPKKESVTDAAATEQTTMVLKLSQLYMIYEDIKMKKVNLYFKLRALDDQLLNFYDYEDENGIGEDQIVDFMRLKH